MAEQMIKQNKPLTQLDKQTLKKIKLIVFDVDGILVPRGTKISQKGDITTLQTKKIEKYQIKQIKKLNKLGFKININSGRGLYMLQEMFREVLQFVSLTYENGSATWYNGKIYQHINSFAKLKNIKQKLEKIKNKNIKGFEPKEFIVTLHCKKRIKKIEDTLKQQKNLYYIWNDEAYDIGIKKLQTKSSGLKALQKILKINKNNIMAIGDNYNDKDLLDTTGISISADKSRLAGDYSIPLNNNNLPAKQLMTRIIQLSK